MLSVITSTGHQQSYISSVKQDTSAQTQVKAVHSLLIDKQLAKLYTVHVRVGSNFFSNIQIFGQIIGVGDGT